MAEWYCNYATGDDTTGDGSIGTPYKTIQKALTTLTPSVYNTVYVLADELLASPLAHQTTTGGLVITGCLALTPPIITSSASSAVATSSGIYTRYHHLKLVNKAAWSFTALSVQLLQCEVVLAGQLTISSSGSIIDSYVHGTGGTYAIFGSAGGQAIRSVIDAVGVGVAPLSMTVARDCLVITRDSSRRGISGYISATGNTVIAPAGSTASGLFGSEGNRVCITQNNIVVGYATGVESGGIVTGNSFWNCGTNVVSPNVECDSDDLASDPFADSDAEDFTPTNLGDLSAGGFPWWADQIATVNSRYRGAIQPAAGSSTFNPFRPRAFGG